MFLSVSHNLKTPLNSIKLITDSMLKEPKLNKYRDKFNLIMNSEMFLEAMISDILDYNSLE